MLKHLAATTRASTLVAGSILTSAGLAMATLGTGIAAAAPLSPVSLSPSQAPTGPPRVSASNNAIDNLAKAGLGGGSGLLIVTEGDHAAACTLTTIGHNEKGELVGITAGHCGDIGKQVYAEYRQDIGPVGTVITKNATLDYEVIKFDPAKVIPLRTVGGTTISGISRSTPKSSQYTCKNGRTTGKTCGLTWFGDNSVQYSQMCVAEGDSGSPIVLGDKLIGMVTDYYVMACVGPEAGIDINKILKDMGGTFTPI